MSELFFQVFKNLVVRGRVSSTGGKVIKWSQSALLLTEVGQEYVHLWFDPVKLAKVLTGIHERSGFPGLKEPFSACCQWLPCKPFTHVHFLITPLRPLTLRMRILMHYMPYF